MKFQNRDLWTPFESFDRQKNRVFFRRGLESRVQMGRRREEFILNTTLSNLNSPIAVLGEPK